MATPSEKLAESLEALHTLQRVVAIRSSQLTRTHRERLMRAGFLECVLKGWYIATSPAGDAGETAAWYGAFWRFCAQYLAERFGEAWSLGPEQSLALHVGDGMVPRQLVVRATHARNGVTELVHDTSLLEVRAKLPRPEETVTRDGMRLFSMAAGLVAVAPSYFRENSVNAKAALASIRDASELLGPLLAGGHSVVAGRLAGALVDVGKPRMADELVAAMEAAGYEVRPSSPFEEAAESPAAFARLRSPYVNRIAMLWQAMRSDVLAVFPEAPGRPRGRRAFLKRVDERYGDDAYHSLSIEGYQVTPELIERVRRGRYRPDASDSDRTQRDALAARGYWQAFKAVRKSVARVLEGESPGQVADEDHSAWYRELFAPSVTAGLVSAADLAGYRGAPVFIRGSRHVPPNVEAVRDAMPALFDQLRQEKEAAVRAVLGHFVFVFIHPYMDGNGRMGRFLMNVMLCSGGWPWTVIPVSRRADYMAALEAASVGGRIEPLARLVAELVEAAP